MIKLLFLFGEICSGKSTFRPDGTSTRIEVSKIVRQITKATTREELQNTKHLDKVIAQALIDEIWDHYTYVFDEHNTPEYLIVDGIRQHSILESVVGYVQQHLPNFSIEYKWLEVPTAERKRRFESRKDKKDTISFEQAEKRDNQLGLSELFSILKEQNKI